MYHEVMIQLSVLGGVTVEKATSVFVALSPNNDYIGNLRSAITLLRTWKERGSLESVQVSTYRSCAARAWTYLQGTDFLRSVRGPKIRSFYLNILNPDDSDPVTIDGHMVSLWFGYQMTMKDVVIQRRLWSYEKIAQNFRVVGSMFNLRANQVQAICWFTWKRVHNVKYSAQSDLFHSSTDQWKIGQPLEMLSPFRARTTDQLPR